VTHNTLERLHTYTLSHKGLSTFAMLFIIATLMLSACGGGSSGPQSKEGGNLNVGLSSDLITLDPLKSAEFVERQVMIRWFRLVHKINFFLIWQLPGHIHHQRA